MPTDIFFLRFFQTEILFSLVLNFNWTIGKLFRLILIGLRNAIAQKKTFLMPFFGYLLHGTIIAHQISNNFEPNIVVSFDFLMRTAKETIFHNLLSFFLHTAFTFGFSFFLNNAKRLLTTCIQPKFHPSSINTYTEKKSQFTYLNFIYAKIKITQHFTFFDKQNTYKTNKETI